MKVESNTSCDCDSNIANYQNGQGVVCAIFFCHNYFQQKNGRRSFFRFPKNDENRCLEWLAAAKRLDLDEVFRKEGPSKLYNFRVCEDHFNENDFRNPGMKSQGLKRNAVPSRKLPKHDRSGIAECRRRKELGLGSTSNSALQEPASSNGMADVDNSLPYDADMIVSLPIDVDVNITIPEDESRDEAKKITTDLKRRIKLLQNRVRRLQSSNIALRKKLKEQRHQKCTHTVDDDFSLSQERLAKFKSRGRRYFEYDKRFALALRHLSPQAYKLMQKTTLLPSERTLRTWISKEL